MRAPPAAANRAFAFLVVPLVLAACPQRTPEVPATSARVRVRSFTEASPVHRLLAVPPFAFAVTSAGLDRWDLRSGQAVHFGVENGLPGSRIEALDYDRTHKELWIATDAGLVRYDLEAAAFREVLPPPSVLGIDSYESATLAAASGGGAWLGLARGLYHVTREGEWAPTGITSAVTGLLVGGESTLWIGTTAGLFVSQDGVAHALGPERGCDLASVRILALGPDGRILAVGENGAGRQRIAVVSSGHLCQSYRSSPEQTWHAVASRGDELLILTDRQLYSMRRWGEVGRVLVRKGMRLLQVPRSDGERPAPSTYVIQAHRATLPSGAQTLAAAGSEVLVGTRALGTARVASRGQLQWLRRAELVEQASGLSVACATRADCYIATGSRRAWRFDGERFTPTGGGQRRVLAVARASKGKIVGLREGADPRRIQVSEIARGEWRDLGLAVEAPGRDPELAFARFSPNGLLWLGLRFRDQAGELRPHGVALVDLELGVVAYHHASDDAGEQARGVLSIPIGVSAIDFVSEDEAWLATSQGAARVVGKKVTVWSEAEGLKSEILRGVVCSAGGMVYVAGGGGIATFDGERWRYPRALTHPVNDIEIGPDGRLWLATERGLAVYDGARVRRLDARRGLIEDRVLDVATDQFGRVWFRGAQSIGIVTP
jgi:ligand-binding sensor domain-containing protein